MKQSVYGLLLLMALSIPPVANLMESIMIVHMHMQMPLLVVAGFFMARYLQLRFPHFFESWNNNGVPGMILFTIVVSYWMIPRTMDEAITIQSVEIFKFFSLAILAGVPLRDSWKKLGQIGRNIMISLFATLFFVMGWVYVNSPEQLCNNYRLVEQITLGWGFFTTAICMVIYLIYISIVDRSAYE
ncbi:MAG: hypothetical protein P0Y55_00865 [Candidatus Cohnella colombiensis]|uniref:Uncharacterized protein n=1 Tax=Candidatus Cohnella colombiensis TaxID=3121368 RepID=A0AA95EX14_9BACL|nr:MAG: hypothetical protein P0Y55_00865 [Cohnella sp.]